MNIFSCFHQWGLPKLHCHRHPVLLWRPQANEAGLGEVRRLSRTGASQFLIIWLLSEDTVVFQAQGNERQAVFCHKGPEGGKNHDQDSSVCSDLLLWRLRLWKGKICSYPSVYSCNLIALHGKRITTGWHCDANIGKHKQQCDIFASVNLRVKDEVSNISFNSFFFCRWMQSNTTVN